MDKDDDARPQPGEEDEAASKPSEEESASGTDEGADEGEDGGQEDADQAAQDGADEGEGEGEGDDDKPKDPTKPFQKRINKMGQRISEAEARAEAAEAELAKLKSKNTAPAESDEAAGQVEDPEVYKEMGRKEAQQQAEIQKFNDDCDAVFDAGAEAYDDFADKIGVLNTLGGMEYDIVKDALVTDAPHEVLYQLAQDPDNIDRIASMSSAKRIAEFTKLAIKAGEKPKPKPSQASDPIEPITTGGGNKDFDFSDDDVDDEEWFRRRQDHVDKVGLQ